MDTTMTLFRCLAHVNFMIKTGGNLPVSKYKDEEQRNLATSRCLQFPQQRQWQNEKYRVTAVEAKDVGVTEKATVVARQASVTEIEEVREKY